MKILWISHDPIRTQLQQHHSSSGFWKEALLHQLINHTDLEIYVCFPGKASQRINERSFEFQFPEKPRMHELPAITIRQLQQIINTVQPQLIHVHGTEIPYGLISQHTTIPVVISLQGFLAEWYSSVLGDIALPVWKQLRTMKERVKRNGFPDMHAHWFYNSKTEIKTVQNNRYFIGRTLFDEHFVRKHHSNAIYFKGHEMLRSAFYDHQWQLNKVQRHSIYTSSFSNPVKGFHVLLQALPFIRQQYPAVQLLVPGSFGSRQYSSIFGNAYFRYLKQLMDEFQLGAHIKFLGKLDGVAVAAQLEQAHVFALPSFMENSSNALGEAQVVGTPSVATPCGGTQDLLQHEHNALLCRRGDAYDMARQICTIFENDELAMSLSAKARQFGQRFHSPELIRKQYYSIYQNIITSAGSIQ